LAIQLITHPIKNHIQIKMKLTFAYFLFLSTAAAFAPQASTQTSTALNAETSGRREFFSKAAVTAAAVVAAAPAANAVVDYENIAYLGGSSIIDVNNANVRAYLKLPGMYPTVAGKVVTGSTRAVSSLRPLLLTTSLTVSTTDCKYHQFR
jgi:hypothetical protein